MIREVRMDEYEQLMELYLHLHETSVPPAELTRPLWERLVNDPDYHLIAAEEDGKLVWKCPKCGNTDQTKMNVARRTCGYIGTQFWNQGRTQEIRDRVLHL